MNWVTGLGTTALGALIYKRTLEQPPVVLIDPYAPAVIFESPFSNWPMGFLNVPVEKGPPQ